VRPVHALAALLLLGGCASAPPRTGPPTTAAPAPPPAEVARPAAPAPLGPFESGDWIVTFARAGDTTESLAARFLGDPARAWVIEDFNGITSVAPGQKIVIPRRDWNPVGVEPDGYQLVPILTYHDIGPQAKGRLVIAAKAFEEQMRYLKANGYRVVTLREFHDFLAGTRQLPRRAVVITFDDGYRSFLTYAYPVLRELGFRATLFVYTDYVGGGRNALGWDDLKRLAAEGFEIEGHSKTHSDLRRRQGEPDAEYHRRLRAEMEVPQRLFRERLGRPAEFLAYPYGAVDDDVIPAARDYGYRAGFTVLREGNSAFVPFFRIRRSQIYAEMTLEDFVRNLNTFAEERLR
jgi:peptidoglycan/xylan/chitin deacetylase (PgdA/CDA1 family)